MTDYHPDARDPKRKADQFESQKVKELIEAIYRDATPSHLRPAEAPKPGQQLREAMNLLINDDGICKMRKVLVEE